MENYKGFKIEADGTFGMVSVKPVGKGSSPSALRGAFTSYGVAKLAIDSVVKAKEKESK